MTETNLVRKIQKYCKDNDIYVVKIWGGVGFQSSGIPDLLICKNGKFVAFETKVGKNDVSKLQEWHINQINKSGGKALVIRTLKEAIEVLNEII